MISALGNTVKDSMLCQFGGVFRNLRVPERTNALLFAQHKGDERHSGQRAFDGSKFRLEAKRCFTAICIITVARRDRLGVLVCGKNTASTLPYLPANRIFRLPKVQIRKMFPIGCATFLSREYIITALLVSYCHLCV